MRAVKCLITIDIPSKYRQFLLFSPLFYAISHFAFFTRFFTQYFPVSLFFTLLSHSVFHSFAFSHSFIYLFFYTLSISMTVFFLFFLCVFWTRIGIFCSHLARIRFVIHSDTLPLHLCLLNQQREHLVQKLDTETIKIYSLSSNAQALCSALVLTVDSFPF